MQPTPNARILLWPLAIAAAVHVVVMIALVSGTQLFTGRINPVAGQALVGATIIIATIVIVWLLRRVLKDDWGYLQERIGRIRDIDARWVGIVTVVVFLVQALLLWAAHKTFGPSAGVDGTPQGPLLDGATVAELLLILLPAICCGGLLIGGYLYGVAQPFVAAQTTPRTAAILIAVFTALIPLAGVGIITLAAWPAILCASIAGAWLNYTKPTAATAITASTGAWLATALTILFWLTTTP